LLAQSINSNKDVLVTAKNTSDQLKGIGFENTDTTDLNNALRNNNITLACIMLLANMFLKFVSLLGGHFKMILILQNYSQ